MNFATMEQCRELYERSGWGATLPHKASDVQVWWVRAEDVIDGIYFADEGEWVVSPSIHGFRTGAAIYPAYDYGYLLRKLPEPDGDERWVVDKLGSRWHLWETENGYYDEDGNYVLFGDPENALCYHAIEMFKQGQLERESIT